MDQNKKILKLGLVITAVILLLSIGFSLAIRLEGPVFLKSYNERRVYTIDEDDHFQTLDYQVYYITNVDDNRRINKIIFNEAPDIETYLDNMFYFPDIFNMPAQGRNYNDKIFGRYALKEAFLTIDLNNLDKDFETLDLNNAEIYFDNGDTLNVDLGRFIIHNYRNEEEHLESLSSGSSSDGTGKTILAVKEDISLLKIDSPLLGEIEGFAEINIGKNYDPGVGIDYRDIEGIEYKEGDRLIIDSLFAISDNSINRYSSYDIAPRLYYKDKDGNIQTHMIYNIGRNSRNNEYSFIGILKYLRSRGEI